MAPGSHHHQGDHPALAGFGAERWIEGKDRPLILASASPRRREILARLGVPFEVVVTNGEGIPVSAMAADERPEALALAKARAVAQDYPQTVVLGADTVVILEEEPLGKPTSAEEAGAMLRRLRGRWHRVVTGVAVISPGLAQSMREVSRVLMRDYSDAEIDAYVASSDPLDKAGAYAIQSPVFRPVAGLQGCYLNVVGLPLCWAHHMLGQTGLALPAAVAMPVEALICPRCRELTKVPHGPISG